MVTPRNIVFLSDFGHRDPFVGICHSVIARHDPSIKVIDLTHGVEPQNVLAGAMALVDSVAHLPDECVVLAVVDPGVGSRRRAVAIAAADGKTFVGPDNGLLPAAIGRAGGATEAAELDESPWRLQPVSNTFHGRDVFSPVAARLATGGSLAEAGRPIEPSGLHEIRFPRTHASQDMLWTEVIDIDTYGNVRLAATNADLPPGRKPVDAAANGNTFSLMLVDAYESAAPGHLALYTGSTGHLELAVNKGSAAELMDVKSGDEFKILFA